uniref:Immunoglobulin C1-set domain-containing protein n=1 Tax=Serinus canaria TaxID=9135 RepID=A0A8C9MSR1_SERCA
MSPAGRALVIRGPHDPSWVWERCRSDFFLSSLSWCDLVDNKFTPCAQTGSVVPVLVFRPSALSPSSPQLIPVCPLSLPVPPTVSISLEPSSSQPGPGCLLCSVMDFYPAHIHVRRFQGQQELSVVATDVVPNGDWTYQLLVLLETVEHVSLGHPLSRHWGMAQPPRQRGRHWGD